MVPCPELIFFPFFFRVTMVTIAIIFHNHILIVILHGLVYSDFEFRFAGQLSLAFEFRFQRQLCR